MTTTPRVHALTSTWTRRDGETSTARITGTLDKLIEKLEKIASPRELPLFSEPAGAQVETLTHKLHRKTWRWFIDVPPAQGGIVELRDYPAGAIDMFYSSRHVHMVPVTEALAVERISCFDGEALRTNPAPATRAMVEAYAKLIYTHLADELGGTLVRVSCETMSDAPHIKAAA